LLVFSILRSLPQNLKDFAAPESGLIGIEKKFIGREEMQNMIF